MAFFKCKMCGGDLDVHENVSVVECEYRNKTDNSVNGQ